MSQPTQKLSGSLDLKIDQWTSALNAAKKQYDAFKASITPITIPPINTPGTGSSGSGSGGNSNVPKLRTDLAALRAEMALAITQTKLYGTGQDVLAQTLNRVRGEAIALGKTQGAAANDVAAALKLALDATNNLSQVGNVSNGVQVQFQSLANEAKLLKAQLAAVTPATAPADFEALKKKAQDLAVALAALQPAAQGDAQAIAALQAQVNSLNNSLSGAQNNLNGLNQGQNQQAASTGRLTALYGKLGAVIGAIGFKELAEFSRDAALESAKLTNGIVIFGKTLEANGQSIQKGEKLVESLATRFRLSQDDVKGSVTELVRAGASLEQVNALLTGGAASGLAKNGSSAKEGIEGVTAAVISGSSAMLAQIGITENLGPATDKYAKALGKTSDELSNYERIQAAANLVQAATRQENANVEDSYAGLVGRMADATLAADNARKAFGKVVTPLVISLTNAYATSLSLAAEALESIIGGPKAEKSAAERKLTALQTQAKDLQAQVDQLNKDGGFFKFLRLGNTQQALDFVNAEISKTQKKLLELEAANRLVKGGTQNNAVKSQPEKDTVSTTVKGLERIKKLQEQIENSEIKAIPDSEARKIAAAKENFQDILATINKLRQSDPGLASQLDGLEKRAKAVQTTELASIRSEAAKTRAEEAQKRSDAAAQDRGVAEQAEKSATSARIAAMKDGTAKIKAEYAERQRELSLALAKDLEDVKGNEAATARVRAAFKTERASLRSQEIQDLNAFAEQSRQVVIDAERALETARVGAMKEGTAKIRAQYQLERADLEKKLADDLTKVSGNAQAEARVRAAFAGQLASLRIKAENDISKVEADAAKKRADAQKSLNREIIDQELKLATDRAAATGSKTEIEQARYTKQLTDLDRFLNDQRAKYKGNVQVIAQIEGLGRQQRELAEREHQKNLKEIQNAGKLERVTARTNTAIAGVGDLDFAGIAKVRAELDKLRRDSAGNAAAIKVVDDAFAKLNDRAKTLKDQIKKVFEDIAGFRKNLGAELEGLKNQDDPVAQEKTDNKKRLDESKAFFDEQLKLVKDDKDARMRVAIEKSQAELQIAEIALEKKLIRERTINAEILAGNKTLALEQARLNGNDAATLTLETQQAVDAAREKYAKLVKLADGNKDILVALRRSEEEEISIIRQKASNERFRLFEAEIERSKNYLRLLADNASELARGRAQLNNDPLAELEAESATRKRSLAERYSDEIVTRKKAGLDTLELEQQLNEALLQEDQRTSKARTNIFKAEAETRKQIQGIVQAAEKAAAEAAAEVATNSNNPFDTAYTRLRGKLDSIEEKLKEDLEKVGADTAAQVALTKAANSRAKSALTAYNKEIIELEKQRAEAILAIDRGLQNDRFEVLKRAAALTSSPFDDLVGEVQSQLNALDDALATFLKNETLTDDQRTAATTINAQKRTLVFAEAARKQVELEQGIVNAGLQELQFLRESGDAVLTEAQARDLRSATMREEIRIRTANLAVLEREARIGMATADQVRGARQTLTQVQIAYGAELKRTIAALGEQANAANQTVGALQAIENVQKNSGSDRAATGYLAIAKALAEQAERARASGASTAELTQKVLAASSAFKQAEDAASSFLTPKYAGLKSIFDAQGEGSAAFQQNLERYALQISKFYAIAPDVAKQQLLAGLRQGFSSIDLSQASLRDTDLLSKSAEQLGETVAGVPAQFAATAKTVKELETQLKALETQIANGLNLNNVEQTIANNTNSIIKSLGDKYTPFVTGLGQSIANSTLDGFKSAVNQFTAIEIPTLKINLEPQLSAAGRSLPTAPVTINNTQNFTINAKTIEGAPLNVREALGTLKKFAEQETQSGTAVPGK